MPDTDPTSAHQPDQPVGVGPPESTVHQGQQITDVLELDGTVKP